MPANNEKDLERWLRQQMLRERTNPLVRFELRHASPGNKSVPVDTIDIPDGEATDESIMGFVDDILNRARTDADGLGTGPQRYALYAIATGETKPATRFLFRVMPDNDDDFEGSGEESPTLKGLVQQQMRHNEALTRIVVQMAGSMSNTLSRRLDSSDKALEEMMSNRREELKLLEAAQSEQHERDMQLLLTEGGEKRKDMVFERLNQLMPVVMNKLMGRTMVTEQEESSLKPFIESLTPEQFDRIRGNLSQEQQIALMMIIKSMQEKKPPNGVAS